MVNPLFFLKKHRKQKGVTFLEILAVLVILVLIYLAYARSFGQGTDKAKMSDVQNSLKQYQIGFEGTLNTHSGMPLSGSTADMTVLNKNLGAEYQLKNTPVNDSSAQITKLKDPWGKEYTLQAVLSSANNNNGDLLIMRSTGKDKTSNTGADTDMLRYGLGTATYTNSGTANLGLQNYIQVPLVYTANKIDITVSGDSSWDIHYDASVGTDRYTQGGTTKYFSAEGGYVNNTGFKFWFPTVQPYTANWTSTGTTGGGSTDYDKDDIVFVTQYLNGNVKSCSVGLLKNLGSVAYRTVSGSQFITGCQ